MRIGLTGGIASGKSTVSRILAELGSTVIDADAIAREVVGRGTPGLAHIVAAFGPELLTTDGDLDRPAMAAIVFADPRQLARLEEITHPLIAARIAELEQQHSGGVLIHDHPLLVESGMSASMDRVIVVDLPEELQVERAVARGMQEGDVRARMAQQSSRAARLAAATDVIDNSGSVEELRTQVERLYDELR